MERGEKGERGARKGKEKRTGKREEQEEHSGSGINPGGVLGSGPHQVFALHGSAYWWTRAQFSENISVS